MFRLPVVDLIMYKSRFYIAWVSALGGFPSGFDSGARVCWRVKYAGR